MVVHRFLFGLLFAAVLLPAELWAALPAPTVRLGADAALRLDGDNARIQFALLTSGSTIIETINGNGARVAADLSIPYSFVQSSKIDIGAGRATVRVSGKTVVFAHDFTAHESFKGLSPGFLFGLRAPVFAGATWKTEDQNGVLPQTAERTTLAKGRARTFAVTFPGGRMWTISFPVTVKYEICDMRRQNQNEFRVRFVCGEPLTLPVGKGGKSVCTLAASDGAVWAEVCPVVGIAQGSEWVRFSEPGEIRVSSALDFSHAPTRKAPAGFDGVLVATTNGEFRFSKVLAEPRRFYGCLLTSNKLAIPKQESTSLAKSLTRLGYNVVRLYRPHNGLYNVEDPKLRLDEKLCLSMDQFVSDARRGGLYVMMDAVSASEWSWASLGNPTPGLVRPSSALAGAYFLCDDRAFECWRKYATVLYGRSNRIGRKVYPVDSAIPFVLTVEGASAFNAWNELREYPDMGKRYGAWLERKRKEDPDFMRDQACEALDFSVMPLHEKKAASIRRYLAETEAAGIGRMKEHLRSLKSKSLVGSCSATGSYRDVADLRNSTADFVCDSFSLDSQRHLGMKWTEPIRLADWNPLQSQSPISSSVAWQDKAEKPVCIVSWGHAADSHWRSYTGLLVGAHAAKRGWDMLIRNTCPVDDPFVVSADRAAFALFARGDFNPKSDACKMTVSNCFLTVETPRTAGGFSPLPDGRIRAGVLTAALSGSPAAVWASSLGDTPLVKSKRILLTHLTECCCEGTIYADSRRDLILKRGSGARVIRDGSAAITLIVEKASSFKVFALSADGLRADRIPVTAKDGVLSFTVGVRGNRNAQFLYEIVRD